MKLSLLLTSLAALCHAAPSLLQPRASLQQVTNYGSNPTNTKMYIYVPDSVKSNPAIVVAVHHCQGTAQSFFGSTPYASLADQKGYIVIYPESPYSGTCFDVSSKATLTHGGGGNSNSIANMVTYALQKYAADPKRVFLVGASSGAMMANVMAATYPELFNAVIAHSGVPAGCFMSASNQVNAWNGTCANGNVHNTPEAWANVVKNMYPGYTGARPRMMIVHGGADTTLQSRNYNETIAQWAGVFGLNPTAPQQVKGNTPQSGWTTYLWGTQLKGVYEPRYGHNIPIIAADDMEFLGL
ncbi:unnamed protein product [Periconia digitata]|uniref:Carboxylic ester hydrolase n=1 Tax=Periconia digitata TaxID=1303443 RepID=A0A9W4UMJ8_9PLEO|nr:unnamed protein product [Periconia digitata]